MLILLGVAVAIGLSVPALRGRQAAEAGTTAVDPGAFATGACQSMGPTAGDRRTTVFLDAGHGGLDPGALGTTSSGRSVTEADLTLPMELDTASLLRAAGYTVVVSRTGPTNVARLGPDDTTGGILTLLGAHRDVAARAACADDAGAAVLVGIYLDAGASVTDAGSLAAYDDARSFSAENHRLATLVDGDVVASMNAHGWQIPDQGAVPDDQVGSVSGSPDEGGLAAEAAAYGHLMLLGPAATGFFSTPSTMPGTVLEPLFITDPFEASLADSTAGQQAVAQGIARAVEQFLAPTRSPSTTAAG